MEQLKIMVIYSQNDPKWARTRMGKSSTTIGTSGCFLTSLAMFYADRPDKVNTIFTNRGVYVNGALIDSNKAASVLGLTYAGKTTQKQNSICIAETNYYRSSGVPQHFFVWNGDGSIVDPIDGRTKKNPYPIVSYRLFKPLSNQGTFMFLQDVKLKDLTEIQFNKFHDIINIHYDGWTQEMYNKDGRNAFSEWKTAYGQDTNMDKILNIMWIEQKALYQKRLDAEKLLNNGSAGSVDKSAIKDHANQIIKLVS